MSKAAFTEWFNEYIEKVNTQEWEPHLTEVFFAGALADAFEAGSIRPAPCARTCEAKAFEIEIRKLKHQCNELQAQNTALSEKLKSVQHYAWNATEQQARNIKAQGIEEAHMYAIEAGSEHCPEFWHDYADKLRGKK
jgi:hypothetical protein